MNKLVLDIARLFVLILAPAILVNESSCVLASEFVPWRHSKDVKVIPPDNPDRSIIDAAVKDIARAYPKPRFQPPRMAEPVQLETPALTRLFPEHRFYLLGWDEVPVDRGARLGRGYLGLYFTLAVPPAMSDVARSRPVRLDGYGYGEGRPSWTPFPPEVMPLGWKGFGNFRQFGNLLQRNGIKLESLEDATLIWRAFCDVHVKKWIGQHRQLWPTEWVLGETVSNGFRCGYYVTLDAEQRVTAANWVAEPVEPD